MAKQTYDNYYRDYYQKNKERIQAYRHKRYRDFAHVQSKEYYEKNKLSDEGALSYTRQWKMWYGAKKRAEKLGLPFNLELEDVVIPEFCPLLGIRLNTDYSDKSGETSPSLDKIYPEKGYVKGNVAIISKKANRIKSDLTPDMLEKLLNYFKSFENNDL